MRIRIAQCTAGLEMKGPITASAREMPGGWAGRGGGGGGVQGLASL